MKKTIWTMGHFPFTMGGNIDRPIKTTVDAIEEKNLGKGIKGFSFNTPKGVRIAESVTGGIVGDSFKTVIADIKSAPKKVITQQIADVKAFLEKNHAQEYSEKEFFKLYK